MGGDLSVTTGDGRRLGVSWWGVADGAPVFWLHGMPGSRLLRHVGDGYTAHGLRVHTYDRPGYGLSTRATGRRAVDTAADVRAIADASGLDRFAVAGVSAGSSHALAVAAQLPDRVTRCALVAPLGPFAVSGLDFYAGMGAENRDGMARLAQGGEEAEREAQETADWANDGMPGIGLEGEVGAMLREAMREAFRQGLGGYLDDSVANLEDWGFALSTVAAPTRVMVASDDVSAPPTHGEWLAGQLPDAELIRVAGDHFTPREDEEMQLMAWLGHGAA